MENIETYCHKATTEYNEEAYNALAFLMMRRLRKLPRILLIVSGLITVALSAVVMIRSGAVSALGIILLLVGNIAAIFGLFAQRFCVKMMMASNKKGETPQNTYLFSEDKFSVHTPDIVKEYGYGDILRVLEMSGYLFLFMADNLMYMIALKDVKGSQKIFRDFLEEKITQSRKAKG